MSNIRTKPAASRHPAKKCQLCCSDLNESEKDFYPCPCNYQVCICCFKDIKARKGACPNCKTLYRPEKMQHLNPYKRDEILRNEAEKGRKKKSEKKLATQITAALTKTPSKNNEEEKKLSQMFKGIDLAKLRVIQKNLVYVIGLSPELASEKVLSKLEYFGQYGTVQKVVINRNNIYNPGGVNGPCYSAYVTFASENEASTALLAIDQFTVHDRMIRASYGTTKYCSFFLRNQACTNPDCLYLHSTKKECDTFMKDDIQNNKNIFQDQQKIAAKQILDHAADIIKTASNKKIKSVFPSATVIEEKVQQYIAQQKDQSANSECSEKREEKENSESLNKLKCSETETSNSLTKTADPINSQASSYEQPSFLSNVTSSTAISNWEDIERIVTQKREYPPPDSTERSESTRSKLTDADADTHSDQHVNEYEVALPKKDFDNEFPPLNQQGSDGSKKQRVTLSQPQTPFDSQFKTKFDNLKSDVSSLKIDDVPALAKSQSLTLDLDLDTISLNSLKPRLEKNNSRFEFARETQEPEEYNEIFNSIQEYIHSPGNSHTIKGENPSTEPDFASYVLAPVTNSAPNHSAKVFDNEVFELKGDDHIRTDGYLRSSHSSNQQTSCEIDEFEKLFCNNYNPAVPNHNIKPQQQNLAEGCVKAELHTGNQILHPAEQFFMFNSPNANTSSCTSHAKDISANKGSNMYGNVMFNHSNVNAYINNHINMHNTFFDYNTQLYKSS